MSDTAAAAKPVDKDVDNRKEIIRTIKGPVMERLVKTIPAFAAYEDAYGTIMASPDLLYACMQLFRNKRELFQDLLIEIGRASCRERV